MSVAERIQIVEDIWDSISNAPEELVLSEAEKLGLDKRLESYKQNPNDEIEWETLKKNLLQKNRLRNKTKKLFRSCADNI